MKMKKLLLLGGSRYLIPVIECAKKLGVYTITCDYLPDNIAHRYSDEYCNLSIVDKEAILKKAEELKIDGIMSFGTDPGVTTASYVAEKLGLPNTGPYESVSILQNKGLFRKFLTDYGFNTPVSKSYNSNEVEKAIKDFSPILFPLIVKPTDSAGSKGVSKVTDSNQLAEAINFALGCSLSGQFIIEQYLEQIGCSSDSECFSVDGELVFTSWSSQYFDHGASNPFTPTGFTWPSTITEEGIKELKAELARLIKLLNMGTTIYNVEARQTIDGKTYLMEVSPRGGGNRLAEMVRYSTGVDLIEESVKAALGLPVKKIKQVDPEDGWVELILHSSADGVFKGLEIQPEIENEIVEKDLWVKPGDYVESLTGANKSIGTLILKTKNKGQSRELLNCPEKYVRVITSPN